MMRRRPIARMAVTTAVVAGTATAVGGHMQRKQAQAAQAQLAPGAAAAPAPAPAPVEEDPFAQLEKLGQLHAQGILTDEEFAAQKAKLLG
jgi:membrane protease subunit (stomatin/prohibitin family)